MVETRDEFLLAQSGKTLSKKGSRPLVTSKPTGLDEKKKQIASQLFVASWPREAEKARISWAHAIFFILATCQKHLERKGISPSG